MSSKIVSYVCIGLGLLFGYITMTVPMSSSAGPAVLTLGCAAAAWLFWPKQDKTVEKRKEEQDLTRM